MVEEGRYELLPERLLDWFAANARDLPWRRDREPYHVWLSEIMLQQTRVEAVKGYYERFLQALPTIADLADAPYEQVQKLWEGLGYYSRARNLQRAAIRIQQEFGGVFPTDYAAIRSLPGVGDYTAGAIASICFDAPTPAVDGNVLRVLSRIDCLEKNVDEPKVRQELRSALSLVYPKGRCGAFTQSLMELGATVCVPNGAPDCGRCPIQDLCRAYREDRIGEFPIRQQKKARREEELTVLLLRSEQGLAIRKRSSTGLLAGLWELPHVPGFLDEQGALEAARELGCEPTELLRMVHRQHIFTHITWKMRCYELRVRPGGSLTWANEEDLESVYALPTAFRQFFDRREEKK